MRSALEFAATRSKLFFFICLLQVFITGCTTHRIEPATQEAYLGSVAGSVHGGQQPVSGAHIYIMQATASGYGMPSLNIGAPAIAASRGGGLDMLGAYFISDATGGFNISNGYTCTPQSLIYLLVLGGNPGLGPGKTNPSLALAAVLGPCPPVDTFEYSIPILQINELTTVAAVYSLSGFMNSPSQVSTAKTPTAQRGLLNAFLNSSQLVDVASGTVLNSTPNGRGIAPSAKVRTLADILSPCVNSDGSGSACKSLFTATTVAGSIPTDTISALLNIAHYPNAQLPVLYSLVTAAAPYQPTLPKSPADLTLSILFSSGNASPGSPAINSDGSVWLPNTDSSAITIVDSLGNQSSVFAPLGGIFGSNIITLTPPSIAIDLSGVGWMNSSTSGVIETYSPFYGVGVADGGGMQHGDATFNIVLDSRGNAFISDVTSRLVAVFDNDGNVLSGSTGFAKGYGGSGIAVDAADRFFVADPVSNQIVGFNGSGAQATFSGGIPAFFTGGGLTAPNSLAFDSANDLWATNTNNSISKFAGGTGMPFAQSPFTGGGLSFNVAKQPIIPIIIDGAGTAWVANYAGQSISRFSATGNALSPDSTGYPTSGCTPKGLAIDSSGDVWATCDSSTQPLIEFIGTAAPVDTPTSPSKLGVRP